MTSILHILDFELDTALSNGASYIVLTADIEITSGISGMPVNSNVVIDGNSTYTLLTDTSSGSNAPIVTSSDSTLTLKNITLYDDSLDGTDSGALSYYPTSTIYLDNVTVDGVSAVYGQRGGFLGGSSSYSGDIGYIKNSSFENCAFIVNSIGDGYGGILYNYNGTIRLIESTSFENNYMQVSGDYTGVGGV
ncbi:MAG: pectate lyase-like adhesive domain-containing protein, partial [Opitutales bacterium]